MINVFINFFKTILEMIINNGIISTIIAISIMSLLFCKKSK